MHGSIGNQEQTSSENPLELLELEDQFITHLKSMGRSLNTLKNYRTDLECFNNYLKKKRESLDITDFNIAQVELYGTYLQEKYSSDNSRRRRVPSTENFL